MFGDSFVPLNRALKAFAELHGGQFAVQSVSGEGFTATAEGVQAIPDEFSPEFVREHWDAIQQRSPFLVPDGVRDFNAWRTRVFQSVVGLTVDS